MYPPGHVGLTAVLFAPLVCWFRLTGRERIAAECLVVAVAFSLVPDIDTLVPGIVHRGVTHTPLAAVVAGVVVAVVFRRHGVTALANTHPALRWFVGVAGVGSHLLGDVVTPMGIQLLFPVGQTMYSLDVVRASSPLANAVLLLTGSAAVTIVYSVPAGTPSTDREGTAEELSLSPSSRR
jgi:inner membrane protein